MLEHLEDPNKPEHLLEKNQTGSHSLFVLLSISKQSYAEELFKQVLTKAQMLCQRCIIFHKSLVTIR